MQKNQNSKDSHGKGKPAPSGAFTHRIREDGEVFSSEEGRETFSDITPLASVAGSVRMRSTDSDRSVRATPKKARDASPPPQDDLWVVVKNLSQQVAAQQAEMDALRNTIALQQKATANLEKILSNMASQAATTGATPKRKTVATKPNPTTTTATTTTTTTTGQPSKDTRFADAVKRRPTHQQLVERQPDFRKAGAAAWLALKRETSVPAHSAPKVELSFGSPTHLCKRFPYAKAWRPSKGHAGCPHPYQCILTSKQGTSLDLCSHLLVARPSRQPLLEATKIRVQTPGFDISTLEIVPKESLPVKKATEQEPAAPAVDSPLDMAAEITPAIQVDGVTPTVTPIADIEMCL
ncbi:hypothetical protein BASA81_004363 [Batrachochytrium salamandrivorans]|nr:hypothetical protein BASA81_004363 [Batrachochytrium salamandrivorans]